MTVIDGFADKVTSLTSEHQGYIDEVSNLDSTSPTYQADLMRLQQKLDNSSALLDFVVKAAGDYSGDMKQTMLDMARAVTR